MNDVYVECTKLISGADEFVSIATRDLASKLVCEVFGVSDVHIQKTDLGKPFICGNAELELSLAHSENFIVAAVTKECCIGIDVERIHRVSHRIIEKYFMREEQDEILKAVDCAYEETRIWTAKEAHSKCCGLGLDKDTLRWNSITDMSYSLESIMVGEYVVTVCINVSRTN